MMAKKFNGGGIYFNSEIDDKSFNSKLGKMKNNLGGFASGVLKKVGIAIAAAFAVKAVVNFAKEASKLWDTQEEAEKKLSAMMKAQSVYTKENVDEMKKYASELQKITNYGDEAIMPIIANLSKARLSTEQLKEATKQYLNLQASGKSGENLVKALEKPLEMSGSLAEINVYINKENLKGLDIDKQRAVVLDAIKSKYDGVAEAMVEPDKQLANIIGDIKEQFGKIIDDGLDPLRIKLIGVFSYVSDNIGKWLEPVGRGFNGVINTVVEIGSAVKEAFDSGKLDGIKDVFSQVWTLSGQIFDLFKELAIFFTNNLMPALQPIFEAISGIGEVIGAMVKAISTGIAQAGSKNVTFKNLPGTVSGIAGDPNKMKRAKKDIKELTDTEAVYFKTEIDNQKKLAESYQKSIETIDKTIKEKNELLKKSIIERERITEQYYNDVNEIASGKPSKDVLDRLNMSVYSAKRIRKGWQDRANYDNTVVEYLAKDKTAYETLVKDITELYTTYYDEMERRATALQKERDNSSKKQKKDTKELIEGENKVNKTLEERIKLLKESLDITAGKISAVGGVTELSDLPERQRLVGEIEAEIEARTIEIESLKNSTGANEEQIAVLEKMNNAQNQAAQSAISFSNQAMALNYVLQGLSAVSEGVSQHYTDQIAAAGDNEEAAADLAEEQRLAAKGIDIASESIQNFASAGGQLPGLIAMIVGWILRLISEAARYSKTIGEMFAILGRLFEAVGSIAGVIIQLVEKGLWLGSILDTFMFAVEGLANVFRILGAVMQIIFPFMGTFTKMLSTAMDAFDDWIKWLEGYFDQSYQEEKLVEKQIEAAEKQIAATEAQISLMEGQLDELGKIKSAVEKAASINEKLLEIEKKRELREYNKNISSELYTGTLSQIKQGNLYKQGSFDIGLYEAVISDSGEVDIELANRLLTRLKYSELDALDIYSSEMKNKLEGLLENLINYQEEDNNYMSDIASLEEDYITAQDELNSIMSSTSFSMETLGKELWDLIETIDEVTFDDLQAAVKSSLEATASNWKSSIDVFNIALSNLTDDQLVLFTTAIKNLTDSDIQKLGMALSGMAITLPTNLETIFTALKTAIPTATLTTFGSALSNLSVIDIAKFRNSLPTEELVSLMTSLSELTDEQLLNFSNAINGLSSTEISQLAGALSGITTNLPTTVKTIYDNILKSIPTNQLSSMAAALSTLTNSDIKLLGTALTGISTTLPVKLQTIATALSESIPEKELISFGDTLLSLSDTDIIGFQTSLLNASSKISELPYNLQSIYKTMITSIPTESLSSAFSNITKLSDIDIEALKTALPLTSEQLANMQTAGELTTSRLNALGFAIYNTTGTGLYNRSMSLSTAMLQNYQRYLVSNNIVGSSASAFSGTSIAVGKANTKISETSLAADELRKSLSSISTTGLVDSNYGLERAIIELKAEIAGQEETQTQSELYQTYLRQYEAVYREQARVVADKTWAANNVHYDWGLNVEGFGWMENRAAFESAYYDKALAANVIESAALALERGYATGGYTGYGSISDVAGVVHKRELVNEYPYSEMIMQSLNELQAIKTSPTTTNTGTGSVNIVINSDIRTDNPFEILKEWNKIMKPNNYKIELKRI